MLLQSLLRPVLTPIMRGIFDPAQSVSAAWSPLSLWPDGIDSPGMWISPRDLTSEWQDYLGTTPVATPGTVADSSNPVGLARDIRAGAPEVLGPELVVNGDGSSTTGWVLYDATGSISVVSGRLRFTSAGTTNAGILQTVTGLTVGTTYQYEVTLVTLSNPSTYIYLPSGAGFPGGGGFNVTTTYQFAFVANATSFDLVVRFAGGSEVAGNYFEVDNISVKEVPGNHMLQSTSAARPLMSARVNLLTYTEDFSNAVWTKELVTATPTTIVETTATGNHRTSRPMGIVVNNKYSYSVRVKRLVGTRNIDLIGVNAPDFFVQPFVLSGAGTVGTPNIYGSTATLTNASIVLGDDGYYTCSLSVAWSAGTGMALMFDLTNGTSGSYTGDGVSSLQFDGIQWQLGHATPYQSVPGDGSTYATDFPIFQKYDGVDDGMATAAFTAGTLINGMDCMIAVRRDSAAACVAGLYNGIADATKFFGMAESASGSGCVGSGAGTPTVWVDNAQLTGGTAVTRGTLHTALTVGDYHILEFRGLDLSTWTAAGFGLYTSYVFPGPRGDIMLYPSTASTEDKDAARQYLADYYGVTLP